MPRKADGRHEPGRVATERWREGLRSRGAPEACHVDVAVAAAVSVALARVQEAGTDVPLALQGVIADALKILSARGYDTAASKRKAMQRLLGRRDRPALLDAVSAKPRRVTTSMTMTDISPHYFVAENQGPAISRSDEGGSK